MNIVLTVLRESSLILTESNKVIIDVTVNIV